jgi:hypothetical protein
VSLYKEAKAVASDVSSITMEISGHIGKFFDAHEQVKAAAIEQKKNPPKGKSLKAQALDNIFQEMELEHQATELRELLIYGVDPALGAVWSRFQEEFERLQAEQEQERLAQEAKERAALWQRRRLLNRLQDRALIIGAVLIVTTYLHLLFLAIRQMRIAKWGF